METELKFLDKNYVETRIREIKEIRSKQVAYKITSSNRENSKSLYVRFYKVGLKGDEKKFFAVSGVRLSDHILTDYPFKQFIVNPDMQLCKKRKEIFIRTLESAVKLTIRATFIPRPIDLSSQA